MATLSNTERKTLASCERKYYYRYIKGLVPVRSTIPLIYGNLWDDGMNAVYEWIRLHQNQAGIDCIRHGLVKPTIHGGFGVIADKVHDLICDGDPWALGTHARDPVTFPEEGLVKRFLNQCAKELSAGDGTWSPSEAVPGYSMADAFEMEGVFRSMLRVYLRAYLAEDFNNLRVHSVQPTMRSKIYTPKGRRSSVYSYQGVADQIVEDRDGLYWILEQKSTTMSAWHRESGLRVDPQVLSYCWLLWRASGVPIEKIGGIIYSVSRRKEPARPKRLKCKKKPKCVRCAGTGRVGGTMEAGPERDCPACGGSKINHRDCEACSGQGLLGFSSANCDTTPEVFRETVESAGMDPADYAEILDKLDMKRNRWIHRFAVRVYPEEIRSMERELWHISRAKAQVTRTGGESSPRNTEACMVAGRTCAYTAFCRTGSVYDGQNALSLGFEPQEDPLAHHGQPNLWRHG